MNYDTQSTVVRSRESALQTNKLLRNTYALLALTLGNDSRGVNGA